MNKYEIYAIPEQAFKSIFKDIKKAKNYVYIESYTFTEDHITKELIRTLATLNSKVRIKIIVDDIGLSGFSDSIKRIIAASNIEFVVFKPLIHLFRNLKTIASYLQNRSHRKLVLIDDKVGYLGGLNFSAEEIGWRDLSVRITGPILSQLKKSFQEFYNTATKNKNKTKLPRYFTGEDIVLSQFPRRRHRPLRRELIRLIRSAKDEILITTPYFVADVNFLANLRKAAKRGVTVKLLGTKYSDEKIIDILVRYFLNKAYNHKIDVRFFPRMSHAKYLIIDKQYCTFGSSNFNNRSFYHNYEMNIVSKEKDLIRQLHKQFLTDFENSHKYDNVEYVKRSIKTKILEKILRKFKKNL